MAGSESVVKIICGPKVILEHVALSVEPVQGRARVIVIEEGQGGEETSYARESGAQGDGRSRKRANFRTGK